MILGPTNKRRCLPILQENSRIPAILSKISPIEIGAISLGLFVFSCGLMSKSTKKHEIIHYLQWKELGFVGFLLLYPLFWLINLVRYRDGAKAYVEIPFEREAYRHEGDVGYLFTRKPYAWVKYVTSSLNQSSV